MSAVCLFPREDPAGVADPVLASAVRLSRRWRRPRVDPVGVVEPALAGRLTSRSRSRVDPVGTIEDAAGERRRRAALCWGWRSCGGRCPVPRRWRGAADAMACGRRRTGSLNVHICMVVPVHVRSCFKHKMLGLY